jgi:hypothetical protein
MTLGPMNPKRSTMAKKKNKSKNRASGHGHAVASRSRNAKRKSTMIPMSTALRLMGKKKSKKHRKGGYRSSNPFGTVISIRRPVEILTAGAGVLVGVAGAKFLVGLLPAAVTSSTLYSTLAAFGAAVLEWWLLSMVNPEFGASAGLGGIAAAGSIALTNYLPAVGGPLALSGRGQGDFVPAKFAVPQNPILDAATGQPKFMANAVSAYPKPYGVQAA